VRTLALRIHFTSCFQRSLLLTCKCQSLLSRNNLPYTRSLGDLHAAHAPFRMGLHDFKKRFSSHPNAKNGPSSIEKKEAPSEIEAPSPTVPMDSRRRLQVQQVRSEKQRVGVMAPRVPTTYAIHATQDGSSGKSHDAGLSGKEFMRHEPLPTSPSSYGGSISGSGEPLFQDNFAARPVPQEFKPHLRTRDLEVPSTARQDSMRQESFRQNSQRPTMRMELDPEEIESIQLRRSRAKSPVVVAPSREGYVTK
jgi:hypothetical protein